MSFECRLINDSKKTDYCSAKLNIVFVERIVIFESSGVYLAEQFCV